MNINKEIFDIIWAQRTEANDELVKFQNSKNDIKTERREQRDVIVTDLELARQHVRMLELKVKEIDAAIDFVDQEEKFLKEKVKSIETKIVKPISF